MKKLFCTILPLFFAVFSCTTKHQEQEQEIVKYLEDGRVWKRTYYSTGRKILDEGIYHSDTIKDGFHRAHGHDGKLLWEAQFRDGEVHGLLRDYDENSEYNFVAFEGVEKDGKLVGPCKLFHPNGTIKTYTVCDSAGNILHKYLFDEEGRLEHMQSGSKAVARMIWVDTLAWGKGEMFDRNATK